MLQTLMDCNRWQMLPIKLSTKNVRPRDRREHMHLEAVMGIATMDEDKKDLLLEKICHLYPTSFSLPIS